VKPERIFMKRTLMGALAATATFATLASHASTAFADSASYPIEITKRPLTLPAGTFQLNGNATIDLSKGAGTAVELSPNVAYGVNDEVELSLTHQGHGSLLFGPKGTKVYNGFGADVTYWALKAPVGIAPHAGLDVGPFDPKFALGFNVGSRFWYNFSDSVVLSADPRIGFGVANRAGGARDYLSVPVALLVQTTDNLGVRIESGIHGGLNSFGDTYAIPLGVAGIYALNHSVDLGARFTFTGLINGAGAGAFDGRALGLFANFRL
jgi:hypothetical protein